MASTSADDGDESDIQGSVPAQIIAVDLPGDGARLDQALTASLDTALGLSRSRLRKLIEMGAVTTTTGATLLDPSLKVKVPISLCVAPPPPAPIKPQPEEISLDVVYEDAHLIVVNKPPGMVAHPAPGAPNGTLVNALLAHCGASLSGIGGAIRPGIVHRIDKDTSGLLVAAKTDQAHQGLAALFAKHDIERVYEAIVFGAPSHADPRRSRTIGVRFERGSICIDAPIGRHPHDRKRMAVNPNGKPAVTHVYPKHDAFGDVGLVECRLETGRTHQIRVHLSYVGYPIIGDPVYGKSRKLSASKTPEAFSTAINKLKRQALHAKALGFLHPVTGEYLHFSSPTPSDLVPLKKLLLAYDC